MNMETDYAELIEIAANCIALASITGRKLPAKYATLVIEAAELRERCCAEPTDGSHDTAVLDDVFSRAEILRKDIAAVLGTSLAARFAQMNQTKH